MAVWLLTAIFRYLTDPKASVPEDRDTITSPVYCKLLRCIKRDVDLTVIHLAGCGLHISYSDLEKPLKVFLKRTLLEREVLAGFTVAT